MRTDNLTKLQRRKTMQSIRSKGTRIETAVVRELRHRKLYFAQHAKSVFGTPDIVFRRKKVAVFIDSDFWHGHSRRGIMPKSNIEYWGPKIERNRRRDKDVNARLKKEGWRVVRLWGYDIVHCFDKSIAKILEALHALEKVPSASRRSGL